MVVFISKVEQNVPRVDDFDDYRYERAGYGQNEDVFSESTSAKDVLVFDLVVDNDRHHDRVDRLCDDRLDSDTYLVVVHGVHFLNQGHELNHLYPLRQMYL